MHNVELRQFRYFVAVAEERHFGRAAERLRIAQPGLSQQIKSLERLLGRPLLIRDTRGVELTEAGVTLLTQARLVIELANRAVDSVRLAARDKQGLLKVGTSAVGNYPMATDLLREFQVRFPDVQLEIHPGYAPATVEALARRALDVAIVLAPFDQTEQPHYLRLGTVELLVALPEGHRLAALERIPRAELLKEPFLEWPRSVNPVLFDHLHRSLFGDAEHPQLIEVVDVMEGSRLLLVAEGEGIAVPVFPLFAELRIPRVEFRPLERPPLLLEYGVAWFDTHASAHVQSFIDLAGELARSSVRDGGPAGE